MKRIVVVLMFLFVLNGCGPSTRETHFVRFHSNGGNDVAFLEVYDGDIPDVPSTPIKEGNTFVGWFTDEVYSDLFDFSTPLLEDVRLYAKWDVNQYNIQYVDFDAAVLQSSPVAFNADTSNITITPPQREGFTFVGWDTKLPTTMPPNNLTLTALYIVNQYTVQYVDFDGTVLQTASYDYQSDISDTVIPEDPVRIGYTFRGWDRTLSDILPANDIVITAQYDSNNYNLTFVDFDGTMLQTANYHYGDDLSNVTVEHPAREGHTFIGWDQSLPLTMPQQDITISATYQVQHYFVKFDTNGGAHIQTHSNIQYLSLITLPVPQKQNATFLGWLWQDRLVQGDITVTQNMLLEAVWEMDAFADIELYLEALIPDFLEADIALPSTYNAYTITWESSNTAILSNTGTYHRPYQPSIVSLVATLQLAQQTATKTFNINVNGYKSLAAPLTSSYVYRDYPLVTDSFFETLDIINCAFITANAQGALSGSSVLRNINTYIMPKARENGNWVLFSVAPDSEWSAIAASPTKINTFADNIVAMINEYGFDGVDIDWETPTTQEAPRFTEMMEAIYTKVKANNPNHLVTAAIAGGMWQPPRYDLVNSHQYIDYINMMTYGMVNNGGYYQNALHKSTTFANTSRSAGKTLISCSIEESVAIYNTYGIPNSKIIVGVAFYGIKQTRTYDTSNQTWSPWGREGSVHYTSIASYYLNNSGYTRYYDSTSGVPFILSNDGTEFISYDDTQSIGDKSAFIIDNNLAGMMYWEDGLDHTGSLLAAMKTGLKTSIE